MLKNLGVDLSFPNPKYMGISLGSRISLLIIWAFPWQIGTQIQSLNSKVYFICDSKYFALYKEIKRVILFPILHSRLILKYVKVDLSLELVNQSEIKCYNKKEGEKSLIYQPLDMKFPEILRKYFNNTEDICVVQYASQMEST